MAVRYVVEDVELQWGKKKEATVKADRKSQRRLMDLFGNGSNSLLRNSHSF